MAFGPNLDAGDGVGRGVGGTVDENLRTANALEDAPEGQADVQANVQDDVQSFDEEDAACEDAPEQKVDLRKRITDTTPITRRMTRGVADQTAIQPLIFTNQHVIDAFASVSLAGGLKQWDLLTWAGLSIETMGANRTAQYTSKPIAELPGISASEKKAINDKIVELLADAVIWVGAIDAAQGLNVRWGPGGEHTPIGILSNGARVNVTAEQGDWLQIFMNNRIGFVHGDFVTRVGDASARVDTKKTTSTHTGSRYLRHQPGVDQLPMPPTPDNAITQNTATMDPRSKLLTTIWNQYGNLLESLGDQLDINPAVAVAVVAAEAGGLLLRHDPRMVIRFENHIFYREWGKHNQALFQTYFRYNAEKTWQNHQWRPDPNQAWRDFHGNQDKEWEVLNFAQRLDDTAAKRAISMGVAQIMGFNHSALGYGSVQEMFDMMSQSVRYQLIGFFDFVRSKPNAAPSLRQQDFHSFASAYNGPGQADYYGRLIREGYERVLSLQGNS